MVNTREIRNTKGNYSMKKITIIFLCTFVILLIAPNSAQADVGPKPSIVINFYGLEGQSYYATLLSSEKSTGPFSALNDSSHKRIRYQSGDKDYDIFLKFAKYQESDDFYFLQYFKNCTQTNQFSWTYYPPQTFKILLYFPDTDSFMISANQYERYAFDSYYNAKVSSVGLTAVKSYDYTNEMFSLMVRIILTISAELGIAILFGFREGKQLRFIMWVNVITQILLNTALNIINYRLGALAFIIFYILLEVMVFMIEAVLYTWFMKKYSMKKVPAWKPGIYALTANMISFVLGFALAYIIPGIF